MALSSPYSNLMYVGTPLNYTSSFDWLEKTAKERNELDENAYLYVSDLKNKALNIHFLNQTAQGKVTEYNTEIENFFKNNDLNKVDLADYKTTNNYTKIFDKLVGDTNLTRAYSVDKQVQSTWNTWKEAAKNPSKTGYSEANYNVWQNEHLMPYIQENNMAKIPTMDSGIFDPEYDYKKELKGLKTEVHFNGQKWEVPDGKGGKTITDWQGVSAERLLQYYKGALSSKGANQMIKEAKSAFYSQYNQTPPEQREQIAQGLFDRDKKTFDDYKQKLDKQVEEWKGQQSVSSPADQKKFQEQIDLATNESKNSTFTRSLNDYTSLSKVALATQYATSNFRDRLVNMAEGAAWQIKKVSNDIDKVYTWRQDMNFKVDNEKYDRNLDAVKNQQWQMNYNLNAAKFQHEVQDDAEKNAINGIKAANSGKSKADAKLSKDSNGFFSGHTTGDVVSGQMTTDQLDAKINGLNSQLQTIVPETLTKESVKTMLDNNDGTILSSTIKSIAKQDGYTGIVTEAMLGRIKGHVKNELEQGNLHNYFNEVRTQKELYQNIKDRTWNQIMEEKVYPLQPNLRGKDNATIQAFFNNNPSLAKSIKLYRDSKITAEMTSVKGNDYIFDTEKDKDTSFRNLNVLTAIANSDAKVLKEIGIPEGTALTRDMISTAQYSPISGRTKITLKDDIDKDNTRGYNGRVFTVDTPTAIRKELNVDYSHKNMLATTTGFYKGSYQNASYVISRDESNSNHWFMKIKFADGTEMNTMGGYSNGQYRPATPVESDNVEDIERNVQDVIRKKNSQTK